MPPLRVGTLAIGLPEGRGLGRIEASEGPSVLLIDDRDTVPAEVLARFDMVFEPEELLPDGTDAFEAAFREAVDQWLSAVFPGTLEGVPLSDLLWSNVFHQSDLADRLNQAAIATEVWRRFSPNTVILGTPPPLCELVAETARRRGLLPSGSAVARWMFRLQQVGHAVGGLVINTGRLLSRVRRRMDTAQAPQVPAGSIDPEIWAAVPGKWPHSGRHVAEAFVAPSLAQGRKVGLAFEQTYRDGNDPEEEGEALILAKITDMSGGRVPSAIDQIAGIATLSELLPTLALWIPLSLRATWSCLIHANSLRIGPVHLSSTDDLLPLLRLLGNDLLRTVEAGMAARQFLRNHPALRTMVFALANAGEAKIVDIIFQRAGVQTIDFQHAYFSDGCIATQFRSHSTALACWTRNEEKRFARNGTNSRCEGGFMPRRLPAPRSESIPLRPTVLVMSSYLNLTNLAFRRRHTKYARRLASALGDLQQALGDSIEVVVRLHPHEDRIAWQGLLDKNCSTASLSDVRDLADDLERSHIAVGGASSAAIEAILHQLPLVFYEGPLLSRSSVLGQLPPNRRFSTGVQLIQAIRSILAAGCQTETGPLELCFGPPLAPRSFIDFVDEFSQ